MFQDLYSDARLIELRQRQDDLKGESIGLGYDFRELQKQVRKMALVNQALYEILRERVDITDEELRLKVREIDRRDGVDDGKLTARPLNCPKCQSAVTAGSLSCPSCGATVAPKYPFES